MDDIIGVVELGFIKTIHADRHMVDIQPYRWVNPIQDVPLLRSPGFIGLPSENDIVAFLYDNRGNPYVIGVFPSVLKERGESSAIRKLDSSDILMVAGVDGNLVSLQLLATKGMIALTNANVHGLELHSESGLLLLKGFAKKSSFNGVEERIGAVRRPSILMPIPSETGEVEVVKALTTDLNTFGGVLTSDLALATPSYELYEKRTEIGISGTKSLLYPNGMPLYTETIGNVVTTTPGVYTEEVNTSTGIGLGTPLRKKTVYYNAVTTLPALVEEIDAKGNIHIYIPVTNGATEINIDGLSASIIASVQSVLLTVTNGLSITGDTNINGTLNLNGGTDQVVLANKLITALSTYLVGHTHPGDGQAVFTTSLTSAEIASTSMSGT